MPPTARLHPSQVRSSCERCRRHKLRCKREPATAVQCSTCLRLGHECVSGQQRKVGRPMKRGKDLVAVRGSSLAQLDREIQLLVPQTEPQHFDWMFDEGAHLFPNPTWDQALASFNDASLLPELSLPGKDDFLTIRTPDVHFATLSRLNCRLNAASNVFDKASANGVTLDGLVWGMCIDEGDMKTPLGRHGLKVLLETAQEFLKAIRAIHQKVGIHLRPSTSEDPFADPSPSVELQKVDSPTAFLVISCFSQVLKILELVYVIITTRFYQPSVLNPGPPQYVIPSTISFADVNIPDFTTQMSVFSEMSRHLLVQMMLVLGLPGTRWPGGTAWNGLLQDDKYRNMLNDELGCASDGLWTRRPANVLAMMNTAREMILVQSMSGYTFPPV